MSAPDQVIREILEQTRLNPSKATAQLTACYPNSWIDVSRCAAADIENYKRRHAFKPGDDPDGDAIVVLNESKDRLWVPREKMQRCHILMRIELISRKTWEHNRATKTEVKYWHESVRAVP
jgi:hypothetical protein